MLKFIVACAALFISIPCFAVNPGFLSGVTTISDGSVYTYSVDRSTDTTIINSKSDDSAGLLVVLPGSPQVGDSYRIANSLSGSNCDEYGYSLEDTCIRVDGGSIQLNDGYGDISNELCFATCSEGAIVQYDGTTYTDIGDSF